MNIIQSLDDLVSTPARKLSDYAHQRKRGADIKIGGEMVISGGVLALIMSAIMGYYIFTVAMIIMLSGYIIIGAWRPEVQALRPPDTDINKFLRIIILTIGINTIIVGGLNGNGFETLFGVAFVVQVIGDQIQTYRRTNG